MITIEEPARDKMKSNEQITREKLETVCHELMEVYLLTGNEEVNELLQSTMSLAIAFKETDKVPLKEVTGPYEHLDPGWVEPFDGTVYC